MKNYGQKKGIIFYLYYIYTYINKINKYIRKQFLNKINKILIF